MADTQPTIRPSATQPTQLKRIRGDGRIYKRGDVFWIAFYTGGRQVREPAHTRDQGKAERLLQRRRNAARAHEQNPQANPFITRKESKRTIADLMTALLNHFKAQDQASAPTVSNIKLIRTVFGERRATSLTASDVNRWITERRDAGYANATVNRAIEILRQGYKLVKVPEPGPEPIVRLDESGNVRRGFFSEGEARHVMAHLPQDIADFTLFALNTGMRKGEAASLKWTDVEGESIVLRAENAKTGKARIIPLVDELSELIARRKAVRSVKRNGTVTLCAFIFHRNGEPIGEFRKCWHTACIRAGVGKWVCPECVGEKGTEDEGKPIFELDAKSNCPHCRKRWKSEDRKYCGKLFHDLRRSAVRYMVSAGVPQDDAMAISGHRTNAMFQRYSIRTADDLRRAMKLTQEYRKTAKGNVVAMAATGD